MFGLLLYYSNIFARVTSVRLVKLIFLLCYLKAPEKEKLYKALQVVI